MKNKKEKIEKVILGILTFVLIVYISFSLIFLSLYKTSEKFLNKKNVSEFIDDINIIDVLKEEENIVTNIVKQCMENDLKYPMYE